jgi:phenylacetate-coenzyme A ligase PaaK-like adenylate-forming protein
VRNPGAASTRLARARWREDERQWTIQSIIQSCYQARPWDKILMHTRKAARPSFCRSSATPGRIHDGAAMMNATIVLVSGGNTKRQVQILRDLGSTVLCCTPSYALLIAEMAAEEGIDTAALPLRVGIFGAEPWSEQMRQEIQTR